MGGHRQTRDDRMTKLGWRSPESSNLCNFDQIAEAFGGIIAMGPWGRAGSLSSFIWRSWV